MLLSVSASFPPALALLAGVRLEEGRLDEAEALATQALAASAELPLALAVRGYARHAAGDWKGALADLERAVSLDPARPDAAFWQGSVLFERNRIGEAARLLEKVLPLEPEQGSGRAAFARAAIALARDLGGREPLRVPEGFKGLVAPFEMRPNVPAVRVRLGDSLEGTMIVNPGSAATLLYASAAKAVTPRRDAALPASALTGLPFPSLPAVLSSLTVAGVRIEDVPVVLNEAPFSASLGDLLGVIGLPTLRRFRVVLDGFGGVLRLDPPSGAGGYSFGVGDAPGPLSAAFLPMRVAGGVLTLKGKVGTSLERHFFLDPSLVETTLDAGILDREFGLRQGAKGVGAVAMTDPTGRPFSALRARLPAPISIGTLEFGDLTVKGVDLSAHSRAARCVVAGLIGFDLLARSRVTLDFGASQAMFETIVPQKAPPR
ncbi:MAG TPA: tetratricopeptide repeat protein [Planctomycetota bacterium]|jgi:hypothetical protein|nr:tetratricopeptide repeat protein [Planctomycetota bacterium]